MITEKQRLERQKHLGSTDIAAILGEDPWRTGFDVWLEKTGRLIPEVEKENKSLIVGSFLEVGVLDWAETQLGKLQRYHNNDEEKKENIEIIVPGFEMIVDHPDAIVIETKKPVEGKTAGLMGPLNEDYGDGGNALPIRVIIQCHVHILATGSDCCHVPALLGGKGFVMYYVEKDDVILNAIMDSSEKFWDEYVLKDVPPPNVLPTGEYTKRIRREPNKTIIIPDYVVRNWLGSKESLKHAEAIKDSAENELLAAMQDAEAGEYSDGIITYYQQQIRRIDSTLLKKDLPDIAEQYTKVNKFRVLRNKDKPKPKSKFDIDSTVTKFIE